MRLTVERLGHRGDGIAQAEGGRVMVPRALPGEVVEGTVTAGRMETPAIVVPVAERVRAPCPHYRTCGGCALQHAGDAFVARWKAGVVERALAAQGIEAQAAAVATSPPRSRRRAVLSARRTKRGALVGFHARGSAAITAIPFCLVLRPAIIAALPALEALTGAGAARSAELALTVTETGAGLDVRVADGKPLDLRLRQDLAGIADTKGSRA